MNVFRRLGALFRKGKLDADMAEELRAHLELQTEHNLAAGMSADEASYAAQRAFGGVEQIKERARDERRWNWVHQCIQDLRYAIRQCRKAPGFTTVIVATLALGIGACTTIFSVVNGLILNPRGYARPDRLMWLRETQLPRIPESNASLPNILDWRSEAKSFSDIAAWSDNGFILTGEGDPEIVAAGRVTSNYFDVLGVQMLLGRTFHAGEDAVGQGHLLVLSYPLWQRRFGGATDVIGRTVQINFEPVTVIGVTPEWFSRNGETHRAWIAGDANTRGNSNFTNRSARSFQAFGRLKPGTTVVQAQAELDVIAARLARQYPASNEGWGVSVTPLSRVINREWRSSLWTLFAAVGCVLLIACANVASLLLARATSRQREMAVRTALGAGRGRLVRQLLTESLLLALLGGGLGLLLAHWGLDALRGFASIRRMEQLAFVELDAPMLGFAFSLSVVTGLVFGLAPAWMASRTDLREALNQGSRGSTEGGARARLRSLLVMLEVALAMVLLAGAGLFVRSFLRLAQADAGFVPAGATSMVIGLRGERYSKPKQQLAFANALLARLRSLPDVQAAGLATLLPLNFGETRYRDLAIEGRPEMARTAMPRTSYNVVSPDYLRAMGIRLLRGRDFSDHDDSAAPSVTIINETLARQHFPNEDPIGRRIQTRTNVWHEIVGIAADASPGTTAEPMTAQIYESFAQFPTTTANFIIRTTGSLPALNSVLAAQVRAVDKDMPIYRIKTLEEGVNDTNAGRRIAMLLLAVFSVVALLLAAVGLYGVISYYVSQRTNEIGIRMALGASPRDVLRLVLGQGCRLVGLGLMIGLIASLASGRMIESMLFNTSGRDPLVLSTIMLLLSSVGLLAGLLPTRRALKVDPMVALRCE